MSAAHPSPPKPDLNLARASVRASLLRANTAVAVVIVTVLALALAALWQGVRATRLEAVARGQQRRAEAAEDESRSELRRALQAEARATRLGPSLGRRAATLDSLRRAAAIAPTIEQRNEAVATLALPERHLEAALALTVDVRTYELDPTLQFCALGLTNGDVVIRRLADGQELRRLRPGPETVPAEQGRPTAFAFSPDGRLLSVRHIRGALAVWDLETGKLKFVQDADQVRHQASRGLFSSDGQWVVAPVFTPDGFAVLESTTGRTLAHFPEIGSYHHAAVRPGAKQFAAYDGTNVLVFDWETRARLLEVPLGFGAYHLAWSPDGRWLGIFGNSLTVQLWDVDARQMRPLLGHQDVVYDACFDPQGERLAAVSYDGVSRIWSLKDGRVLGFSSDARLLRWGPGGRAGWLMPGRRLEVWRETPGASYATAAAADVPADPQQVDVSPDGNWAAAVTDGQDALLVWPLNPAGPPQRFPLSKAQSVCFDPGTNQLLVIRDQGLETIPWSVEAADQHQKFRLGAGEATMPVPRRLIDRVTCSADGRTRAYVNLLAGAVWVQRPEEPETVLELRETLHSRAAYHGGSPWGAATIALSPDGHWLVCGADGGGVRVLETSSGRLVKTLADRMGGVQFSPDGRWLVLNGPPSCVLYRTSDWSVAWEKPLAAYIFQAYGSASFSPDGSQVAYVTAPSRIVLAETGTGRELAVLEAPSGSPPNALRWTPAGNRLIAATREHTLDVWQPAALRRELAELGLDWDAPPPARVPAAMPPALSAGSISGIALGILLTAGVVAAVALLSLRRHRQLIEDFSRTEALASRREQELEIEREVGRLKSSFVAMVSHEFRTPLGITMSAVELLQHYSDRLPEAKRVELLADIHGSTRHMADLMEQVLLLGRVEAGKLGFKPAPLDLVTLAEKLADETHSATHRRCPIRVQLTGDLAGAQGDEALLRHVLGNLIANAVKYSPAGSPVEVTLRREDDTAVISVRDHGIGIPAADLPQLFQAFQRASNVGDIPGTGLGLVIVKRCVDLHAGTIAVNSQAGTGTEFTVRVPLFVSPAAPRSIASVQT